MTKRNAIAKRSNKVVRVLTETANKKVLKRQSLRNNEYYDMQQTLDDLYNASQMNKRFKNLYELIISRENILLAYRNIKKTRDLTKGINESTIVTIGEKDPNALIDYVRKDLKTSYHKIRRKEIPKANGGIRPLGIPTIEDRIIQQCLKQILEQYAKRNSIITVTVFVRTENFTCIF